MFSLSVSDILRVDEFKELNELELIQIKNDERVLNQARTAGLDVTSGYHYFAAKHKNLRGKVVVGYVLSGDLRSDKSFRDSIACTPELLTLCHLSKDVSLHQEMQKLSGGSFAYGKTAEDDADNDRESESLYEPDYKEVENQINLLNKIAYDIRGTYTGANGGVKSFYEWQEGANGK
jgi:hypothetical protein